MKYTTITTLFVALLNIAQLQAASLTEDALLNSSEYLVSGTFGPHDFPPLNDNDPFDWAFTTPEGDVFQLKGTALTAENPFGWRKVSITPPAPAWYMFQLNDDVDGDGSLRYDWVLLSVDMQHRSAYKLAGVTQNGNFAYSDPLDIDYRINGYSIQTGANGSFDTTPNTATASTQYTVMVTPTTATAANGMISCRGAEGTFMLTQQNTITGSVTDGWNNLFSVTGTRDPQTGRVIGGFANTTGNVATYEGVINSTQTSGSWVDAFGCKGVWHASKND